MLVHHVVKESIIHVYLSLHNMQRSVNNQNVMQSGFHLEIFVWEGTGEVD